MFHEESRIVGACTLCNLIAYQSHVHYLLSHELCFLFPKSNFTSATREKKKKRFSDFLMVFCCFFFLFWGRHTRNLIINGMGNERFPTYMDISITFDHRACPVFSLFWRSNKKLIEFNVSKSYLTTVLFTKFGFLVFFCFK